MPWRMSHTSSPVPTSALWRDLVKVAVASKLARPSRARTWPDACENGFSATSGPSLWNTRTTGMPWATLPAIRAFWACR